MVFIQESIKKIEDRLDNILSDSSPSEKDIEFLSELPEQEIEYLQTLSTDYLTSENEKKYLQNYEALAELKKKQSIYNKVIGVISGTTAAGLVTGNAPAVLASSAIGLAAAELSKPVDRLVYVMEMLLEHFGDEGITLTPDVRTGAGKIELLVKLPDRRNFALMMRSKGDRMVRWRADRGDFFIRTRSKTGINSRVYGGLLQSVQKLNEMTVSLKQEGSYLIGSSFKEKKQALIKVLVLTLKTKVDPNNDPSLFVNFGKARVLNVKSGCSIYVVNREDLINFLEPAEKNGSIESKTENNS